MTKIKDLKNKWMKDGSFKKEYDALSYEFELAKSFIDARTNAHMTQKEVAEKMGTTQTVIARLESGKSYLV